MSEPCLEEQAAQAEAPPDCNGLIAALHAAGAQRFDPVRMHYIEVLAERAARHQGSVRRVLEAKVALAAAVLKERFERARSDAGATAARIAQQYPQAAPDARQLLAAGDFKGLQRLVATLNGGEQRALLGALVRQLERQVPDSAGSRPDANAGARPELRAIRESRNTWARLSVDRQVAQALEQVPKNAGPINSHMLVLRSLTLMRDISPDYLGRFISYADSLLCLEQGEQDKAAKPEKPKKRAATTAKNKA